MLNENIIEKLDIDTLFFIFYFRKEHLKSIWLPKSLKKKPGGSIKNI